MVNIHNRNRYPHVLHINSQQVITQKYHSQRCTMDEYCLFESESEILVNVVFSILVFLESARTSQGGRSFSLKKSSKKPTVLLFSSKTG